ncbi:MAG: CDC27 family protein [Planctomycetota bacterium]|nr:CDC27 family protein [Planctomycetota bacterium]
MRATRTRGLEMALCLACLAPVLGAGEEAPAEAWKPEELEAFFSALGEAYRSGQPDRVAPFFDIERAIGAFVEQSTPRDAKIAQSVVMRTGLAVALREAAVDGENFAWERFKVQRVHPLAARGEAIVYVKSWSPENDTAVRRWWLRSAERGFRAFDFEDLDMPVRMSYLVGTVMARTASDPEADKKDVEELLNALRRATDAEAEEEDPFEDLPAGMPRAFDALHLVARATTDMSNGDYAEALAKAEEAAVLRPDFPILDLIRATAWNVEGEHEKALAAARRYVEQMGPCAEASLQLGTALVALGRETEAAAAYREGLDDNPDDPDALAALAAVLPEAERGELVERLGRMHRPEANFEALAELLLYDEALDVLDLLARKFRELRPGDPNGAYYLAQVMLEREQYKPAAALLRDVWPKVEDKDERLAYVNAFLEAMCGAGDELEGYHQAPDKTHAFKYIADYLVNAEDAENLALLAAAHRLKFPNDRWLPYYEGEANLLEEKYDEADACYARGLAMDLDADLRESYLIARVYARFMAGKILDAYADLGRTSAVFEQLANLCLRDNQGEPLERLIAERRKDAPADPALVLWQAEPAWLKRDYAAAVEHLHKHRDTILAGQDREARFHEMLILGLVRLKRFEEAMTAAKASSAYFDAPYYEVIAGAVAGDVEATERALAACIAKGYEAETFFENADAGPALTHEKFAAMRRKFFGLEP